VHLAGEHGLLQGHPGGSGTEVARERLVLHEVGAAEHGAGPVGVGVDDDRDVQGAVTVDDVLVLATFDQVATATAEQDVALGPDTGNGVPVHVQRLVGDTGQRAVTRGRDRLDGVNRGRERLDVVPGACDPVDPGRGEGVTAGEPEPADDPLEGVAPDDVV